MRKGWLLASFGVSLLVVGCGSSSSGGGTGGSGGHAGSGGHGGTLGTGGKAGGGGSGNAAGGAGGAAGGHAGAGGTAGAAGGHAGTGGMAGAAGNAGGNGGMTSTNDGGTDALSACGTSTMTSQPGCNTVDATGPCVTVGTGTGALPAAGGGNIQPGTYDLVSSTVYLGDGALPTILSPVRKTLVLSPGTAGALDIQEADVSGNYLNRFNGTVTTSGTGTASMVTFTQSCPAIDAGAGESSLYTFTSGSTITLTVLEDKGGGATAVEVWQKR